MTESEKQHRTLEFFKANEGREFTAIDINREVNTSDARKIISRLRRAGHRIIDRVINKSNGTKGYHYERNNNSSSN